MVILCIKLFGVLVEKYMANKGNVKVIEIFEILLPTQSAPNYFNYRSKIQLF